LPGLPCKTDKKVLHYEITKPILLVEFEILTVVVLNSTIFYDIQVMSCITLKVSQHHALFVAYFHAGFLLGLFFDYED
jgi:hypothetical protein